MEELEARFVIKPKFNFLYEILMPTGRKIKNSLCIFIVSILLFIILSVFKSFVNLDNLMDAVGFNINFVLNLIFVILIGIFGIKLASHIIFQVLQYKYLSYTFYDTYMIYEDSFLNQHKKTIQYTNIKEVEIRRTIMDRILGFGIIVIYTNAENANNGLVIYSVKNPQGCYDKIQEILRDAKKQDTKETNLRNEAQEKEENPIKSENANEISDIVDLSVKEQEEFNESLKNINN